MSIATKVLVGTCVLLISAAHASRVEAQKDVVFSIPVSDDGVYYYGVNVPETLAIGPTALAAGPDGDLWVLDPNRGRIFRYGQDGHRRQPLELPPTVRGGSDLVVHSNEIAVLDEGGDWPHVASIDLSGALLGYHRLGANTGYHSLMQDPVGNTYVSIGVGPDYILDTASGEAGRGLDASVAAGPDALAALSAEFPRGMQLELQPSSLRPVRGMMVGNALYGVEDSGLLVIGQRRVNLADALPDDVERFTREIERVLVDHRVVVRVLYERPGKRWVNEALVYDSAGRLTSRYSLPIEDQIMFVRHPLAISPEGEVYYMVTRPEQVEVRRLTPSFQTVPILGFATRYPLPPPQALPFDAGYGAWRPGIPRLAIAR